MCCRRDRGGDTQETDLTKGARCRRFGCHDSGGPGAVRLSLSSAREPAVPSTGSLSRSPVPTQAHALQRARVSVSLCTSPPHPALHHRPIIQRVCVCECTCKVFGGQPDTGRPEVSDASALRKEKNK